MRQHGSLGHLAQEVQAAVRHLEANEVDAALVHLHGILDDIGSFIDGLHLALKAADASLAEAVRNAQPGG